MKSRKLFHPLAAQAEAVDALGKHAGEKQGVVADVFAHLALAVEGRGVAVDGIGLQQHLARVVERAAGGIADLVELFRFAELGEQAGDVVADFLVAQADAFGKIPAYQFQKQLLQRMRFRDHGPLLFHTLRVKAMRE